MPVVANLTENIIEPITVPTQIVSRIPLWEITDLTISNKNKFITVSVEKYCYNDANERISLAMQNFTIIDDDFLAMATTVISNQTFYSALKSTLYNYLINKGYLNGTVS